MKLDHDSGGDISRNSKAGVSQSLFSYRRDSPFVRKLLLSKVQKYILHGFMEGHKICSPTAIIYSSLTMGCSHFFTTK